ncbi:MAG: response regulator transcription factor [Sulfurospirillum sp.]|nr:response regulator transcription factor [Sulfurospirillum sp.]
MSIKILILEDNLLLLETLEDFLSEKDCVLHLATTQKKAMQLCYKKRFDIYLLDVKIPDGNGFAFLRDLREAGDQTPAIFITSLEDTQSVKEGFLQGGDDYIKKPFDLEELWLRIGAILHRSGSILEGQIKIDQNFSLHVKRKNLLHNDKEILLNLKDFELLHLLLLHRGKVVTREMIEEKLWHTNECANEGSIRVYINNLKKIFGKDAITNIRGIGYRFEDA